jgi:hypothetical protein
MVDVNTTAAEALAEAVRRTKRVRDAATQLGREMADQQGGSTAGQPPGQGTQPGTPRG